jgi:hypothetical protein
MLVVYIGIFLCAVLVGFMMRWKNKAQSVVEENEVENLQQVFKIKKVKRLWLTYDNVPEFWTKEYVLEQLKGILINRYGENKYRTRVIAWIISEERHQSGERHYHCLLGLDREVNILTEDFLDIEVGRDPKTGEIVLDADGESKKIHGNYQGVRNLWAVINYVKKRGDWISHGFLDEEKGNKYGEFLMARTEVEAKRKVLETGKMPYREMMDYWRENNKGEEMIITHREVEVKFRPFQKIMNVITGETIKAGLPGFGKAERPKGVIIYGQTGAGKSYWLDQLEELTGERIRASTDLDGINDGYKGEQIIVLNEFRGSEFKKYEKQLKMMVTDRRCESNKYKGVSQFPWPRRIVILTNDPVEEWGWTEPLKDRFFLVNVNNKGEHRMKIWEDVNGDGNRVLVEKTDEEALRALGIDIKEVGIREMEREELKNVSE